MAEPVDSLNVIDLDRNSPSLPLLSKLLGKGLEDHGCVYLVNHGIPTNITESFFEISQAFFDRSYEEKYKCRKTDPIAQVFGFVPSGTERAIESATPVKSTSVTKREAFDFPLIVAKRDECENYPEKLKQWMPIIHEFSIATREIMRIILRALAIYVNLDESYFLNMHEAINCANISSASNIRASNYIPLEATFPKERELYRLKAHCDWGSLTLLFQDQHSGLECDITGSGTWISVDPLPGSIVLQLGQAMEIFTGGRLRAVPHRVRLTDANAYAARQTIACFLHPDDDVQCFPRVLQKDGWISPYVGLEGYTHAEAIARKRQRTTVY